MLTISDISRFFPEEVHARKRGMLREYLQYIILQTIYTSKYKNQLIFLWWTCLRIVYNTRRFSEDLDFDNRGMTEGDFTELGVIISQHLGHFWIDCEVKMAFKWAFHCYIRMPKILKEYGLSGYEDEKILIQIDTVPQPYFYEPVFHILGNFWFRETLLATPKEILFAQKIAAAYGRKRTQGRDFYDIQFLLSWWIKPEYSYIEKVFSINNPDELREFMLEKNKWIDFNKLAQDVEPFLFREEDVKLVRDFPKMVESMRL